MCHCLHCSLVIPVNIYCKSENPVDSKVIAFKCQISETFSGFLFVSVIVVHKSVPRHAVVKLVGVASQGLCYQTGA